ncbi:TIGR03790 family protein [Acidicapsa dinghuensis]|uniref:TIGR03790 family protein n=1 Tax=Acidicapsa dinghuensis TaxID=2218256 RepID=A0ABW1EIY0_9BACT|nr:TIGR03790 family protein [Acidicapsa dinghuensis]
MSRISFKRRAILLFLSAFCVVFLSESSAAATVQNSGHSPAEVLLVYNANSPISTAIAKDYAARRHVTKTVIVHCADSAVITTNETISLEEYTAKIATPVERYLQLHKEINFIVLTKGVPIRVDGAITGSRDENTTGNLRASVDSYLAAIDYPSIKDAMKISIHGSGASGFGWLNRYWNADVPFSHARFGGYLVTRLDGYTEADAKALVTRAIEAETEGIHGSKVLLDVQPIFKVDDVESQPLRVTGPIPDESDWGSWNADMVKAAHQLESKKIPAELDMSQTFVGNQSNLLGYFSWGSNDAKYSALAYESLTFAPGSVSDTAVSTSGRTFLHTTGGQSLIADLISHGITGVKGYTDEPLLQAIASPSVLMSRYTSGFTLAESFYAASRFVGWEDIVIGDPLCRPTAWPKQSSK